MDVAGVLTAIGAFATAVAVLVAYWELRLQRLLARTQFEDDLGREYRQLIKPEVAPALFRGPNEGEDVEKLYSAVLQYVDLSNEEAFLRARNRISDDTWRNWSEGIAINLGRYPFKSHWGKMRDDEVDDFLELRLLEDSRFVDPLSWTPRRDRRWLRRSTASIEEASRRLETVMSEENRRYWQALRKRRQPDR